MLKYKICTICKEEKHCTEFFRRTCSSGGLQSSCKVCEYKRKKDHEPIPYATCTKCRIEKPSSEFTKNKKYKTGLLSQCKVCRKEAHDLEETRNKANATKRVWYRKKAEEDPLYFTRSLAKRTGNTSKEQYQQMLDDQKGCCAICGIHYSEYKRVLCIDHNHETGFVRELLCHKCNAGIGLLKEDPEILLKAIEYLKKH